MEDKKQLLPEQEYRAWDKAEIDERMRTMALLLKFNVTEDKKILEEVFGRSMDGVTIFVPLHCNYGDSRVKFDNRVFINYNCTFQPAGGVEIGKGTTIGAGSVVTRSIPARCVAVGNPAKVIKQLQ